MKLIFRIIRILLLFLFLLSGQAIASTSAPICPNDSTQVLVRLPLKASINKFISDREFQYNMDEAPPAANWWGRFWQWFFRHLEKLFHGLDFNKWLIVLNTFGTESLT